MTTIAIHQPNYLPWRGYFDKMSRADVFVVFDDVQLPMGGHAYETHAVINGANGPIALNVPVERRGHALIKDTRIADDRWRRKHQRSLRLNYPASETLEELAKVYDHPWAMLLDLNLTLIALMASWLGIRKPVMLSSQLGVHAHGAEKILGIVEALGGDAYVSGTGVGSRRYVSEEAFAARGIRLAWHEYRGPNVSAVDALLGGGR